MEVTDNKPIIRSEFTNISGEHFKNVREIAFKKEGILSLGKLITVSHTENQETFITDKMQDSMYIFQSNIDPLIGYRIYDEWRDYGFNGYHDDRLISKLQDKQSNVLLTKFPTGVVTYGGFIIGQEIPFFVNSEVLFNHLKKCNRLDALKLYKKILLILKELYQNKIIYTDIHASNFLVTSKNKIELIDFDSSMVSFSEYDFCLNKMFTNLYTMLNKLTYYIYGVEMLLPIYNISHDFDNIEEQLEKSKKKLIK